MKRHFALAAVICAAALALQAEDPKSRVIRRPDLLAQGGTFAIGELDENEKRRQS